MRHCFHIGDEISGTAWTKMYPKLEYADYYRVGNIKKLYEAPMPDESKSSPWIGEVSELSVYDWRGCSVKVPGTFTKGHALSGRNIQGE